MTGAEEGPSVRSSPSEEPAVRVVLVTVPDPETGHSLVRQMVQARLAACGSVVPGLTSIYRWKGEVHQDPESLVIFKTTTSVLEALKTRVVDLHPYEVPEVICLPIIDGAPNYLNWLTDSVGEPSQPTAPAPEPHASRAKPATKNRN